MVAGLLKFIFLSAKPDFSHIFDLFDEEKLILSTNL